MDKNGIKETCKLWVVKLAFGLLSLTLSVRLIFNIISLLILIVNMWFYLFHSQCDYLLVVVVVRELFLTLHPVANIACTITLISKHFFLPKSMRQRNLFIFLFFHHAKINYNLISDVRYKNAGVFFLPFEGNLSFVCNYLAIIFGVCEEVNLITLYVIMWSEKRFMCFGLLLDVKRSLWLVELSPHEWWQ